MQPKLTKFILIPALLFLWVPTLWAATGQAGTLGSEELQAIFTDLVYRSTSLPVDDLVIDNFSSTPDELPVAAGILDYQVISQENGSRLGRQTIVSRITVNGQEQGEVKLNGDLQLYGDVVCTARPLNRHTIIQDGDLTVIRSNITMLGNDILTDISSAIGKQLKTTLRPGALVYQKLLKNPQLVKRGDLVSILAASDSLKITVPGKIVTAGALGELITVKNLMSRKEVFARVVSPDLVEVEF